MRSILVHADRSPSMAARLDTALALAQVGNGHVTVIVDTPVGRYVSMDPMGGGVAASDALSQALSDDDLHAEAVQQRLARTGVSFDVVRSEEEPVDALCAAARLADIVVLSRSSGIAGELTLVSRTPVLVLPDDQPLAVPLGKICIAWDGGEEAALALRWAMPLLAQGESIDVISVLEKPGGFPAGDAMRYLERHGISAEHHELTRTGSTEETLAAAVARADGKLLVMGAYGHSRMRQFLFGGVTRYFLEESEGPALLLAH